LLSSRLCSSYWTHRARRAPRHGADHFAAGTGLDDDVAELVFIRQAPGRIQRELEGGSGGGRAANLARGHLDILLADGADDVPAVRSRAASFCGSSHTRIE